MPGRSPLAVRGWSWLVAGLVAVAGAGTSRMPPAYVVSGFSRTLAAASLQPAASSLPELVEPVNDFAHVIDQASAASIDQMSRALEAASGDAIVVATVPTIEGWADIREYAVRLFENHGRSIGEKGRDNGLLIVVAIQERQVRIEVGYGLEPWITDGFAGETSRLVMAPAFRRGEYGVGLRDATARIVGRIAQGRNITLDLPAVPAPQPPETMPVPVLVMLAVFIAILLMGRLRGGPRRHVRRWGGNRWSGWSSGVGPFGGGWSGGRGGGGGFSGGFGGFGGGRSGGGGGGAHW